MAGQRRVGVPYPQVGVKCSSIVNGSSNGDTLECFLKATADIFVGYSSKSVLAR